ncbi:MULTISPECIES: PepSY domain-containing protein [unclassified Novosphingobium]|uniref:PepSY domain-containing protein n=1 Tax=unclassified Novosphingobium TaxID=2644732 RepID=UPI0025F66A9F|nr:MULTISPECIES: PepSY domain-containing protein [unclassified Novosphingobium]HQV04603.1 PepSY domain-containing protein [Novosphingobium sp.]
MRKWHRWLSVIFGVFLLWIAVTGVMSQFAALVASSEPQPVAAAPAGFVCPESMTCRPKPDPGGARAWVGFLHHLHGGEEFGAAGVAISIAAGLALVFFSVSGLWLYIQMWRHRKARTQKPGWFWH